MNGSKYRSLRALRRFTDNLRALQQEIQAAAEHGETADNAGNRQPVQPLPIVIAQAPQLDPTRREYYDTENRERNSNWRKLKPWVETGGILIAFALAVFNLITLSEIRKQTPRIAESADAAKHSANVAERQLELSERP